MDFNAYAIHFSPLQGYTDRIFRNAFARYFGGVDAYYTPFIRVEKGNIRERDIRDITPGLNTVPRLIPQILPGSAEEFRLLADRICEKGYTAIDINLGCPFPLIANKRKGAGMLPYPELVKEVLAPMSEYRDIRFSIKMRLGWENSDECLFLTDAINALRPVWITVHARTGKQQYKGEPNLEAFQRFYEHCECPLFYNGDVNNRENIQQILARFPLLRGVCVGRCLLSSPMLAKEFRENVTFDSKKRMDLYFSFHQELFSAYSEVLQGDIQLLTKMKTLWEYFLSDTDRKLLKRIKKSTRLTQYTEAVKMIFGK